MAVLYPQHQLQALRERLEQGGLVVACYCAAWCDTCTQYRPDFEALAGKWPDAAFVWIDIEENPELLDDEDVENFPTLLIQGAQGNLFFGPLQPYISHLERLLSRADETAAAISEGPGPLLGLVQSGGG